MPSPSRLQVGIVLVATAFSLDATVAHAQGCWFGHAPRLSELFAQADFAFVVERASRQPPTRRAKRSDTIAEDKRVDVRFRIAEIWKMPADAKFQVGDVRSDSVDRAHARTGLSYLLLAKVDEKTSLPDWLDPLPASEAVLEYFRKRPQNDAPPRDHIRHIVRFLDSQDDEVSELAWEDLSERVDASPSEAKGAVTVEWVRSKLHDPELPVTRLGTCGVLLGLHGDAEDAEWLKRKIAEPTEDFRLGIEGIVAGYLLLTGEKGMDWIDVKRFSPSAQAPFSETYAALNALRILRARFAGRIDDERLKRSMRMLLERPELADLVIMDLARWKDWTLHDRLTQMFDDPAYQENVTKRAIVRYFLLSVREGERAVKAGEPLPAHAARSQAIVETLREKWPQLVIEAGRTLPERD